MPWLCVQAHLKAQAYYSVVANMQGRSAEAVAEPLLTSQQLRGLQVSLSPSTCSMLPPAGSVEGTQHTDDCAPYAGPHHCAHLLP